MLQDSAVASVGQAISLSVAPVFLISSIGALLSVMAARLGRIVDRARVLHVNIGQHPSAEPVAMTRELATLSRRSKLISAAITLSIVSALLVCAVIALLFVGAFLRHDFTRVIAWLFTAAMATLFAGLLVFLREILLATSNLRLDLPRAGSGSS